MRGHLGTVSHTPISPDRIRDSLSKSDTVLGRFTRKEVDRLLLEAYHVKKITELGAVIVDKVQTIGADAARDEFRVQMSSVIGNPTEIPAQELAMVGEMVFDRLWSIGKASIV